MNININASDLSNGLKNLRGIIERRNTIPILANVLIEAKGSAITMRATDLDIEMSIQIPAQIIKAGETTVKEEVFQSYVSKLPRGAITKIEQKDSLLRVSTGRSRSSLQTLPVSDFPSFAKMDETHRFSLTKEQFEKIFGRCQFAISTEETRYHLNGIYFHTAGDKLVGVATDGHRLAKIQMPAPAGSDGMPGIIIPRKAITESMKILAGVDGPVTIWISPARILFDFGATKIASKLIDGTFPDYMRVIPTGNNDTAILQRADFAESADRVATVSSERGNAVCLTFAPGSALKISVDKAENGTAADEVDIEYNGPGIQIGFNAKYLAQILAEIPCEKCKIAMSDPGAPAIITPVDDLNSLYLLMPMRV